MGGFGVLLDLNLGLWSKWRMTYDVQNIFLWECVWRIFQHGGQATFNFEHLYTGIYKTQHAFVPDLHFKHCNVQYHKINNWIKNVYFILTYSLKVNYLVTLLTLQYYHSDNMLSLILWSINHS